MRPSRERLLELLSYDPEAGILTWRQSRGRVAAGQRAGSETPLGYREVGVDGQSIQEHRVIYCMATGEWPEYIDHRDGDGRNNKFLNLRACTQSQNMGNAAKTKRRTTSRFKGVSWCAALEKWRTHISVNGKSTHVGVFLTEAEAAAAYDTAAKKHFGKFARTNGIL